jgi:hypothetical protein
MKKSWFMAVLAALLVVCAGTAIASIPGGSNTSFNVQDPAVTVVSSGQTPGVSGASEACAWAKETTTFCKGEGLSFTPVSNGVCTVNFDAALIGNESKEGSLNSVGYGVAVNSANTADENGVTTTPTNRGEQTVSRSRLVSVEAGVEYNLGIWLRSYEASTGTAYWDLDYVCYG